jgi:hypothetical protein
MGNEDDFDFDDRGSDGQNNFDLETPTWLDLIDRDTIEGPEAMHESIERAREN